MIQITHTTPKRALSHLHKLVRDGEQIFAIDHPRTVVDVARWDIRVWTYLRKIVADEHLFDHLLATSIPAPLDVIFQPPMSSEIRDAMVRQRIGRRLGTLASVIEQVEGIVESGASNQPSRANSP